MWSPLRSRQAWVKMKALPLFPAPNVLCTRQLCWWVSAFVPHWTTHTYTQTHVNTANRTCAWTHFQTPTDTLIFICICSRIQSPMCCDNFSKPPKAQKRWKAADISEELYRADLRIASVTTSDFGSLLQMFSSLCALCKGDGAEAYIGAVITGENGIYMKKKMNLFRKRAAATPSCQVPLRCTTHRRNVNHLSDPERIEFSTFISFSNLFSSGIS